MNVETNKDDPAWSEFRQADRAALRAFYFTIPWLVLLILPWTNLPKALGITVFIILFPFGYVSVWKWWTADAYHRQCLCPNCGQLFFVRVWGVRSFGITRCVHCGTR